MGVLPNYQGTLWWDIHYLIDKSRAYVFLISIVTIKFYGKYSNMIIIIYIQLAKQQKPNCKDLQFGFFLYTVFTDWTGDQTFSSSHIKA